MSEVKFRFSYKRGRVFRLNTGIMVPVSSWNVAKEHLIVPRIPGREQIAISRLQNKIDDLERYLKSEGYPPSLCTYNNSLCNQTFNKGSDIATSRFSVSISSFFVRALFTVATLAEEPSLYF